MQGWLSILIMIALGAGFALVVDPALEPARPAQAHAGEARAVRVRHAGGRRRARTAVGEVLPGGDDLPAVRHRGRLSVSVGDGAARSRVDGFVQVVLFMLLLLAGYVYVWRKGALDWGSESN